MFNSLLCKILLIYAWSYRTRVFPTVYVFPIWLSRCLDFIEGACILDSDKGTKNDYDFGTEFMQPQTQSGKQYYEVCHDHNAGWCRACEYSWQRHKKGNRKMEEKKGGLVNNDLSIRQT